MKKILCSLTLAIVLLVNSITASAADWTWLGSEYFRFISNNVYQTGEIHGAFGGGYKINVGEHTVKDMLGSGDATMTVTLYEDDGSLGYSYVDSWTFMGGYARVLVYDYVYDWHDGLNGEAEFFIKVKTNYSTTEYSVPFTYYD